MDPFGCITNNFCAELPPANGYPIPQEDPCDPMNDPELQPYQSYVGGPMLG